MPVRSSRRRLLSAWPLAALALTLSATGVAADDGHPPDPQGNPTPVEIKSGRLHLLEQHPGTGGHVMIEGNRLYVGAYGKGMRAFDITNPASPDEIWNYEPGTPRADAVPDAAVLNGRHIVVLNGTSRATGSPPTNTNRAEFFDLTDPDNPELLWTFNGPNDGESHNGDIVDVRRLWLPSGAGNRTVTENGAPVIYKNGLRIYDLNPLLGDTPAAPAILSRSDPKELWENSPYRNGRPVGPNFTHTHDITVYTDYPVRQPNGTTAKRDIVLLAEGGNYINNAGNTGSMFVIDITDPRSPVALLRWLHETGPGHHPIRYHHEAQFIDGLDNVVLVTDEDLHNGCTGAGGATAIRLSPSLTSAVELSEWFIPMDTPAPVCSVHVFDSYQGLVFFGAYNAGLQVVDYRKPTEPTLIEYAIEPGTSAWGADFHRGFVYVGDVTRGLDVFRYRIPDLTLGSGDIRAQRLSSNTFRLTANVHNIGHYIAGNVTVTFRSGGRTIGTTTVDVVPVTGSAVATINWRVSSMSGRTVTVVVDPERRVIESLETNNRASRTFGTTAASSASSAHFAMLRASTLL